MEKKLNLTAYSLIISNVINTIINLFGNTFLVAFFLQVSSENIPNVALFYIITYAVMLTVFPALMALVKKTKRMGIYRVGIVIKCLFILLIALLKEKITTYVVLVALFNGLSETFYWCSYNVLKNETMSSKVLMKYQEVYSIINKVVNLVFPVVLGAAIEFSSFLYIAFYVLGFGILQFISSFFIKNPNAVVDKYHLIEFIKITKQPDMKPLRDSYVIMFLNGLKAVISTLTTLVIMMTFNSNMSLGVISSVFSILSILGTFLFFKLYKPEKSKLLYILCGVMPVLATIGMLVSLNKITFIIFNFIYTICMVTPEFIVDVVKNRTVREVNMHKYICEHQAYSEIFTNLARVLVYGVLYVMSAFQNAMLFKIFLLIAVISLPILCLYLYKIEMEMFLFHKAHREARERKEKEKLENNLHEVLKDESEFALKKEEDVNYMENSNLNETKRKL